MSGLIIPDGKATGCLPRERKPGDVCGSYRDAFIIYSVDDLVDRIREIDQLTNGQGLKQFVADIYNQDGVGSCSSESANGCFAATRVAEGQEHVAFNPWGTYHFTSGGRDQGSTLYDNLVSLQQRGAVRDELWPRYDSSGRVVHSWRERPSQEALDDAQRFRLGEFWELRNVAELASAYVDGFGCVYGWSGHSCWIPYLHPSTTNQVSQWVATYANSWDESWGDNGYGTIRLGEINWSYQAFAYRTSRTWVDAA